MAAHRNSPRVCPHGVLSGGYPRALRHPGWPLDSLAVRMDTGTYFMEDHAAVQTDDATLSDLALPYRPWLEASMQALADLQRNEGEKET